LAISFELYSHKILRYTTPEMNDNALFKKNTQKYVLNINIKYGSSVINI